MSFLAVFQVFFLWQFLSFLSFFRMSCCLLGFWFFCCSWDFSPEVGYCSLTHSGENNDV